jgi:hypothetical protein
LFVVFALSRTDMFSRNSANRTNVVGSTFFVSESAVLATAARAATSNDSACFFSCASDVARSIAGVKAEASVVGWPSEFRSRVSRATVAAFVAHPGVPFCPPRLAESFALAATAMSTTRSQTSGSKFEGHGGRGASRGTGEKGVAGVAGVPTCGDAETLFRRRRVEARREGFIAAPVGHAARAVTRHEEDRLDVICTREKPVVAHESQSPTKMLSSACAKNTGSVVSLDFLLANGRKSATRHVRVF